MKKWKKSLQEKHHKYLGTGLKTNDEPHSKYSPWGKQGGIDTLSQTESGLE